MRTVSRSLLGLLTIALLSAAPRAGAEPVRGSVIQGGLPLAFLRRPAADGSRRMRSASATAPVTIRFVTPPTDADVAALRKLGVDVARGPGGIPAVYGDALLADLPATAVQAVASLPRVTAVALDGSPFPSPHPLDGTAALVQATDVWRTRTPDGVPLTGAGITICDIDSGVDPFHPLLFRADGGYFAWIDVDGDGAFTPGIDGVDLGDGAPTRLRVQNGVVTNFWNDEPLFGSEGLAYDPGLDFLYADANDNGQRDFGPAAGFGEADPTYGERLFVADDVNRNGKLDPGEKIVALATSKLRAVRIDNKIYRRGQDLVDTPVDESAAHGTGASGVLVGGQRGLGRLVGMAPDADLVVATDTQGNGSTKMANFCVAEGARVVLHEYAPWVGYHLDGSSPMEALIDTTAAKTDGQGVSHINPAGNLSTSQKLFKKAIPAGAETIVTIAAPPDTGYGAFTVLGLSVLWRDPTRKLALTLEDPTGFSKPLPSGGAPIFVDWHDGLKIYAEIAVSNRGTVRVDAYVFSQAQNPPPIPLGDWKLHVVDPSPAGSPSLDLVAYVLDELSGWGKGIHFPDDASEDHLIGYPGTADHGLAVAAYTGHGWNGGEPGTRAYYSGRGHRIDGAPILWISGPDDPITSGHRTGSPGRLFVYGGTSGASPHVAGAAALLLQADPTRTGDDVKQAIGAGALADAAVGEAPNDDYGHGKLQIFQSLYGQDPPGGSAPTLAIERVKAAPGEEAKVPVQAADADEPASGLVIELDRDYDGTYEEKLSGPSFTASYSDEGRHYIKVRVTDATGREAATLAVVDVQRPVEPKGDDPPPAVPPPSLRAGGGSCAYSHDALPSPIWPLAAAALLALRRFRRNAPSPERTK